EPAATAARATRCNVSVDPLMTVPLRRIRARTEVAAEIRVDAAVRRLGIGDGVARVVDVGGVGAAGLVGPGPARVLPIPMEIGAGCDDGRNLVALVGTGAARRQPRDAVGTGRRQHGGAAQAGVDRAGRPPRLGERVGAMVVAVVITVIVILDEPGVVPEHR